MLLRMLRSGNADLFSVIIYILSTLLTIFLVLPLHECAHGFVAYKLGDDTAKREGRITLNPLKHINYFGAALMLLIGFGWAEPVPVDPRNFKNPKAGMAITAFAGPLSNMLAAIVAGLLSNTVVLLYSKEIMPAGPVIGKYHLIIYILLFFEFLIRINVGLAVFNFIPIPPLDGSKILMAVLPDRLIMSIAVFERYISIGLFVLIMMGGLNGILDAATGVMYNFVAWLTWLPFSWI